MNTTTRQLGLALFESKAKVRAICERLKEEKLTHDAVVLRAVVAEPVLWSECFDEAKALLLRADHWFGA